MRKRIVTREELYDAVWAEPMTKLGQRFGVSDVAIKKICVKLKVPRPPPGHWQRVAAGHNVARTPLSIAEDGDPTEHEIDSSQVSGRRTKVVAAGHPLPEVVIPATLDYACPLVKKTARVPRTKYQDDRGMYYGLARHGYLDVAVSRESLDRTLRLLEAINSGISAFGLKLETNDESTLVRVAGEEVTIRIEEKANRFDYVPTAEEKAKRYFYHPKWRYEPSGRLTVKTWHRAFYGYRSTWSDGKVQKVEDRAPAIVKWLGDSRAVIEGYKKECEERERQREIDEQLRRDESRRRGLKKKRLEIILQKADLAEELGKLRHLISGLEEGSKDLLRWRELAIEHADEIESKLRSWPNYDTAGLDDWQLRSLGGYGWG